MEKKAKTVRVMIIKCSQEQAWYNDHIGETFECLERMEHHQGKHHGDIYDTINPETTKNPTGWIFADDVVLLEN